MNTMMKTVHAERVTQDCGRLPSYLIDASELGLRPGEWPEHLACDFGNGQPLDLCDVQEDGTHVYAQRFGAVRVYVIND